MRLLRRVDWWKVATVAVGTMVMVLYLSGPANAADTRSPVYVEVHASGVWPVAPAVKFLGKYTHTHPMVHGCVAGVPCIRVYQTSNVWELGGPSVVASTRVDGPAGVLAPFESITFNSRQSRLAYGLRLNAVIHELGHAYGLGHNMTPCASVMAPSLQGCHGRANPRRFSPGELAILRWM